ncbi:MAG: LD-carboxypeptidase [bacterium]
MKIIKPQKISRGDLIGIIAPASSVTDDSLIQKSYNYFEGLGYKVRLGKNIYKKNGYLAGTDEQRLVDLHDFFSDKNIKAIFCLRGGYGSGRLLDKINYDMIKKNPKIFVGYSDITSLQMAFLSKVGLVTFSGPMAATDFICELHPNAEDFFWRIITSNKKIGKVINPNREKFNIIKKGQSEGILVGGNLSILISLFGTGYLPLLKNFILLLEEINENPYKIDRMLNQLRLAEYFKNMRGVILGEFVDCNEPDKNKNSLSLNEVIIDYFGKMKIPIISNFMYGHINEKLTIPFGIKSKLNASRSSVEILEAAVI